jgi:epoxyqueuosine reductase
MDKRISDILAACGAAEAGALGWDDLRNDLEPGARAKLEGDFPNLAGVIVAAFPYFAGRTEGNLSLYARGEDYHRAVTRRLDSACAELKKLYPRNRFAAFTDNNPIPEVAAARRAGIGILGRNGLLAVKKYGTYVFLGEILTDLPLSRAGREAGLCSNCGACVKACPAGALSNGKLGPVPGRCLSGVSQRKGELSPEEERLLRALPTVWGCDLCQRACPLNRGALPSPLPDLAGRGAVPYLSSLSLADLENLNGGAFRVKYGDRAFAWRGPEVLRRNLRLKDGGERG